MARVGPTFPLRRVVVLAALQLAVLAGLAVWWTSSRDDHDANAYAHAAARTTPAAKSHRFDAARALRTVRLQLAAGQRPAGSPQLRRVAVQLRDRLPDAHFEDVPAHPRLRN